MNSKSVSSESNDKPKLKVPRLCSLEHRLRHAKDADGNPIPLDDELLFLLDDPPAGITDRWQAGADLCAEHGIATSRMAVWRFYRATIFQWRREQLPPPVPAPVDPVDVGRLHDQARHLLALRVVEMLNDPNLSPGHLIALLQNENLRQKIELARDQFLDRLDDREYERGCALLKEQEREARHVESREELRKLWQEAKPAISLQPPAAPPKSPAMPAHTAK